MKYSLEDKKEFFVVKGSLLRLLEENRILAIQKRKDFYIDKILAESTPLKKWNEGEK